MSHGPYPRMGFCSKPESGARDVVVRTTEGQHGKRSAHGPQIQKAADKDHQTSLTVDRNVEGCDAQT